MNEIQAINVLLKIRSLTDTELGKMARVNTLAPTKPFNTLPVSVRLLNILKFNGLENYTPVEFVSKVSQVGFKRCRNVGRMCFKEMSDLISEMELEWLTIYAHDKII